MREREREKKPNKKLREMGKMETRTSKTTKFIM